MSAWIVSKAHIDALVQSLAVERIVPFAEADEIGRKLWEENYRSVNYRYDENASTPEYHFDGVEAPLDPFKMFVLVQCYEYQSCEHPEWGESEAARLMYSLQARLLEQLGLAEDEARRDPRWGPSPWGIESIDEVLAKEVAA